MREIRHKILEFRDQRDWEKFHNEKDLAISIPLKANELLENFQWKSSEEAIAESKQNIKEEMADKMEIDLEQGVYHKLEKNAEKYPIKGEKRQ